MKRSHRSIAMVTGGVLVIALAGPALACGGLIGPRGAVQLTRTTTLAAHHNGFEHYITSFKYAGAGGKFGSLVPLPGKPTKLEKGGRWTLQRLDQETREFGGVSAAGSVGLSKGSGGAVVVQKKRIDSLDLTVLKGGGRAVGIWASENGFRLPPDAPEVLDFYARRSPYFMAAAFDKGEADRRGQQIGDGTPIHITIPLWNPWVPLRILGLGKQAQEQIQADVYLLTDRTPNLLPAGELAGYQVERIVPASEQLLTDLRTDRGMEWVPKSGMTLTHLVMTGKASQVKYDLAVETHGGVPSRIRAGLPPLPPSTPTPAPTVAPTPTPVPTPEESYEPLAVSITDYKPSWPVAVAAIFVSVAALLALALTWRRVRRGSA